MSETDARINNGVSVSSRLPAVAKRMTDKEIFAEVKAVVGTTRSPSDCL